jgi:hypothetical protein
MNKKVLTLSAVMASMLFGAAAHAADTRIGVTIYKYDDNFMPDQARSLSGLFCFSRQRGFLFGDDTFKPVQL